MRISEVSKRYAKALYMVLKQNNQQAQGLHSLQAIEGALVSDPTVLELFVNPGITDQQKDECIKKAFSGRGLSPEVVRFVEILIDKKRISEITNITNAYKNLMDDESGVTRGVVKSAKALSSEQIKNLEEKIKGILKKKVALTFEEDRSLLGGVVAQVGGWTFDDSLDMHLKNLNESLIK